MNALLEFGKNTLVGGLVVVLPVYLVALLVAKSVMGVLALFKPIAAMFPAESRWHGPIALAIFLGACFVAGLLVRTGPGHRLKQAFDRRLLERIPGYALLRGLTSRMAGAAHDSSFAPALVEIEDALVPAFVVESHDDGSFTVFVPSVPTPAAGTVYILPPERVHLVELPVTTAVSVVARWGQGAESMRKAMVPRG